VTLRARLTTVFVAVVVIPLVIGTVLLASALPRAFTEQQGASVQSLAALGGDVVRGLCAQASGAAEAGGRGVLAFPAGAVQEQQAVLRSLVERGLADGLRVTDGAGRVAVVGQAPESAPVCGAVVSGVPGVAAGVLLEQAGTGNAQAIAVVELDDEVVARFVQRTGGDVALLAGNSVIASSADLPEQMLRRALAAPGDPVTGGGRTAVLSPAADGQPLGVLVSQPVTGGLALLGTAVVVVLGAALLAALLALWLARATVRPLEELGEAAARVASGDLSTSIDVRGQDEVGQLARAFNTMTEELRHHVGALEASRDELRAGLARLGQTLTSTHDLDRILGVVLETALASTTARSGAVLLREHDSDGLVLAAGRGLPDHAAGRRCCRPGRGLAVALDGRRGAARRPSRATPPLDRGALGAGRPAARQRRGARRAGALRPPPRQRRRRRRPHPPLRTLADQAAVAVENVLRHRDVALMAVTDGLTGLANYRSFTETIGREIERATRFGRPGGPGAARHRPLQARQRHLRPPARRRRPGRAGRPGARAGARRRHRGALRREELVVVLPETDVHGAEQAAERIRAAVPSAPFGALAEVPRPRHRVARRGGARRARDDGVRALLRRADEALYAAKAAGRNTWRSARPIRGRARRSRTGGRRRGGPPLGSRHVPPAASPRR
jgi:HAMP domain-containing protein/GGDEF domain-containing protein